jgi:RNA polymerase sigma-70 factor (ECF subfamily)
MTGDGDDRDCLAGVCRGDAPALGIVLERYWASVVRYAQRMLASRDAAEDVAQEVFVRLWERRDAWEPDASLRALLFRLAHNLSVDELRRRGARQRAEQRVVPPTRPPTPQGSLESDEIGAAVTTAVNALPERRRDVFVLIRYHGLSYKDAADVLGLSPQTVANHLHLAVADLRTALAPYYYDQSGRAMLRSAHRSA